MRDGTRRRRRIENGQGEGIEGRDNDLEGKEEKGDD